MVTFCSAKHFKHIILLRHPFDRVTHEWRICWISGGEWRHLMELQGLRDQWMRTCFLAWSLFVL